MFMYQHAKSIATDTVGVEREMEKRRGKARRDGAKWEGKRRGMKGQEGPKLGEEGERMVEARGKGRGKARSG